MKNLLLTLAFAVISGVIIVSCGGGSENTGPASTLTLKGAGN